MHGHPRWPHDALFASGQADADLVAALWPDRDELDGAADRAGLRRDRVVDEHGITLAQAIPFEPRHRCEPAVPRGGPASDRTCVGTTTPLVVAQKRRRAFLPNESSEQTRRPNQSCVLTNLPADVALATAGHGRSLSATTSEVVVPNANFPTMRLVANPARPEAFSAVTTPTSVLERDVGLRAMADLFEAIEDIATKTRFSGVVRVDHGSTTLLANAYGLGDRRHDIANDVDTQFAIASGSKGLTALAMVSLIESGTLTLSTTARSVLGTDLPLIDDSVTIEQLLSHRSGIGDYLDEDAGHAITDYLMPVPVHELATTEQFLTVLDGQPTKFAPGEQFSYCNGGFVVLALIAERASGVAFHDLVHERVCAPARMLDTEYLRSDELPGRAAIGYLDVDGSSRTNVFHLPVRGNGDGGVYTTAADIVSLWEALFAGRIVSTRWVDEMVRPRSDAPAESKRYGLGFWLAESGDAVILEGYDAGVSFRSVHDPVRQLTHTVIANTSAGAWLITKRLAELHSTDKPA